MCKVYYWMHILCFDFSKSISNFSGYLLPNPSFKKDNRGTIKPILSPSPQDICPKMNVIARPEFKLEYYDSAVECFNHYTTGTETPCMYIVYY